MKIVVPSLGIDLHFPMRLNVVSIADLFGAAILLALMERAAGIIGAAIQTAQQAQQQAIDAANASQAAPVAGEDTPAAVVAQ